MTNEYAIESFINFCEDMKIAEEGKLLNKIKRAINNTINKRLKMPKVLHRKMLK